MFARALRFRTLNAVWNLFSRLKLPMLLKDTIAYLCNYQGKVLWVSDSNVETKVGDFVWKQVREDQVDAMKSQFAEAATLSIPQTGEGATKTGELFRGWAWGLNSPDYAVCALFVELPKSIGQLTDKERELMSGLAVGRTVRQLANEQDISVSTVHTHLRRVRDKLCLDSHEALIGFAGRYLAPLKPPSQPVSSGFRVNSQPSSGFSESLSRMSGTHALICDWQGSIVWQSQSGTMANVGDPIWKYCHEDYSDRVRHGVARCVTLNEPQSGEAFNQRGEYFRIYSWPLMSPEAAMFVLLVQLPTELSGFTDREREIMEMLGIGMRVKEIAETLDLGTTTVHSALKGVRTRLGLPSQESLIGFAARFCHPHELPLSKQS